MEIKNPNFRGSLPLMITPVTEDGEPDLKSLRNVVEFCIENKSAGIGAFGGVSEYTKISDYDRQAILETIVDQTAGRVPVFVGPAAMSMKNTLANVEQAEKLGGEMLMVSSPADGSMKSEALFDYYKAISEHSPLPIMVQDTGGSSSAYSPRFVAKLYHELDTVTCGKIEGGADFLLKMNELKELVDDDFQIIAGSGGKHMLQILRAGVTAIIAGTYFIDIYSHVIQLWLAGEIDKAIDFYHNTVLPYIQIMSFNKKPIMKYVLKRRGIIACDDILFPYDSPRLDDYYKKEVDWMLERIEANIERFK